MKNILTLLLFVIIFVLAFLVIQQRCSEPLEPVDYSSEIKALEADTTARGDKIRGLETILDSLLKVPPTIRKQVIRVIDTIDARIEEDSTYAIVAFRDGLQRWNTIPDGTDYPTYREFGYSAKYMQEGYGYKLQVKEYEEKIVPNLETTVEDYKGLYKSSTNLNKIKDLSLEQKDIEIGKLDSFWRHRFVVYAGGGANYDGTTLRPGLQLGIGVRIWGNE